MKIPRLPSFFSTSPSHLNLHVPIQTLPVVCRRWRGKNHSKCKCQGKGRISGTANHILLTKIAFLSFQDLHIILYFKTNFSIGNFMQKIKKRKMHLLTPKRLFLQNSKSLPYKSTLRI